MPATVMLCGTAGRWLHMDWLITDNPTPAQMQGIADPSHMIPRSMVDRSVAFSVDSVRRARELARASIERASSRLP